MPIKAGRASDRKWIRKWGRWCLLERKALSPTKGENGLQTYYNQEADSRGYLTWDTQRLKIVLKNDSRKHSYDAAGAWEKGECHAIIPAHIELDEEDVIVDLEFEVRKTIHITRGSTPKTADLIKNPHVVRVLALLEDNKKYNEGTDFTLEIESGQASIAWQPGGSEPVGGKDYAVVLAVRPVWIVAESPRIRSFGKGKRGQLPWGVKLKRDTPAIRQ